MPRTLLRFADWRRRCRSGSAGVAALVGFLAGLLVPLVVWGFTVDDALITCRYAHHVANGEGYVFNRGGPVTDGVTPLGFPYLLAPFAAETPLDALFAAKLIGLVMHAVGAALVSFTVAKVEGSVWRFAGVVVWLVAAPTNAWSVAGLETGFVEGLVAIGASLRVLGAMEPLGVLLLGLAAGLRPELLPLAATLGMPRASSDSGAHASGAALGARVFYRLALVCAPFAVVAAVRLAIFGRVAPLSAQAKPADIGLGLDYAVVCVAVVGYVGLLAPMTLKFAPRFARWLVAGALVHAAAVTFAGGDWMPVSRLFVPVLPVVALATGWLGALSKARWTALRAGLALVGEIWVWNAVGYKLVRVQRERAKLIEDMRGPLAGARVIAAVDVGWLGVAAPEATIVDLAGVTDPEVARLPGGHLRKKIPDGLLAARGTDTIVLSLFKDLPVEEPWPRSVFGKGLEMYVATEPGLADRFEPTYVFEGRSRYVVLRRRIDPASRASPASQLPEAEAPKASE